MASEQSSPWSSPTAQAAEERNSAEKQLEAADLATERAQIEAVRAANEKAAAQNERAAAETAVQKAQWDTRLAKCAREQEELAADALRKQRDADSSAAADARKQLSSVLEQIESARKEIDSLKGRSASASAIQNASASLAQAEDLASKPVKLPEPVETADDAGARALAVDLFSTVARERLNAYEQITSAKYRTYKVLPLWLLQDAQVRLNEVRALGEQPGLNPAQRKERQMLLRRGLENVTVSLRDMSRSSTFPVRDQILSLVGETQPA